MILRNKSLEFILERHKDQVDKAGKPYVLHLLRVGMAMQRWGENVMAAAFLHDVVEDDRATLEEVRALFGYEVARMVDALTRRKGERYFDYIQRVASSDKEVMYIKWMDLEDNLDRLLELSPESRGDLESRYRRAITIIQESIEKRSDVTRLLAEWENR